MEVDENELNQNGADPVKKPYHNPVVKPYGSLADLVQMNFENGDDGNTTWADCTSS